MATKNSSETAAGDAEHEYVFSDWVYQVPGYLLILGGFGTLLAMTFL
jgi:hypothetical protein